ncbi:hypothetical protein F9C07_11719 [Aspergillus flavus]|uniref:Uncharacterized protein n=2 Tax=Aspergillus subgen. Circumdati TaxID=2720871 RepID=A0A7U2N2Y3_ASPFN|nr:hypothetical protein Ao3042_02214 [Aspergillus oryzae 3.042]KDE75074.1 hypothetical protein AO1008_11395 [Aspergillus oryzae 100-8]QRD94566.1 hypothetical protein F9C07_11719 [Aspergillus flavus]|eukprot:EIT81238.1 hypothetical protein Ao3042_02214 [Aspergillus oryzae 3.042]
MPCYHEMSPFSQVPGRKERRDSVSSLASVSSTMEDDSLVHRPSMSYVNVPDSSLHGLSGRVRTNGYLYICCNCHDGPKLYNNQPRCVMCQHVVCSDCQHVK